MALRVILTGATGLVGEGVLLECLENPAVERVLAVGRRRYPVTHAKLDQCLVPDFLDLSAAERALTGYHACFYCAGISSRGLNEAAYRHITYDIPLHFARTVGRLNPRLTFSHISGQSTDSTGQGRIMWARIKGQTENALHHCGLAHVYNLRPGLMRPSPGQRNVKGYYRAIASLYPLFHALFPRRVSTLEQVGRAMIATALTGSAKATLEVPDILDLAATLPL